MVLPLRFGTPPEVEIVSPLLEKTLKSGIFVEVYLVKRTAKHGMQFEAALYRDLKYRIGPSIPQPVENPTEAVAYWMGGLLKVGFSQEEGDEIIGEVSIQNRLKKYTFKETWGVGQQ